MHRGLASDRLPGPDPSPLSRLCDFNPTYRCALPAVLIDRQTCLVARCESFFSQSAGIELPMQIAIMRSESRIPCSTGRMVPLQLFK